MFEVKLHMHTGAKRSPSINYLGTIRTAISLRLEWHPTRTVCSGLVMITPKHRAERIIASARLIIHHVAMPLCVLLELWGV